MRQNCAYKVAESLSDKIKRHTLDFMYLYPTYVSKLPLAFIDMVENIHLTKLIKENRLILVNRACKCELSVSCRLVCLPVSVSAKYLPRQIT